MPKSKNTKENIHELKNILINAIILSKETDVDSELLQKKFDLTQFGASCILYMMRREEYCPELEKYYKQKILRGKNNTDRIIFIENIEPYEINDESRSDMSYETKLSYVTTGFAEWITYEKARQQYINVMIALIRYKNPQIPVIAEMIRNRDEERLKKFFKDQDEEKVVEILTLYKFSAEDIEVVLEIVL